MTRNIRLHATALAAVLLTACAGGAAAATSSRTSPSATRPLNLAGTWSGRYSGSYSGTFTLRWRQAGSHLRGSITLSNPRGTYSISGNLHGRAVEFGAVGVGATYTGSVSGRSMSGSYETPGGGGPWHARKTS